MKICKADAEGCVERYMNEGGPRCWDTREISRNCNYWAGIKCDDCGVTFCRLSPRRPDVRSIDGKDHWFCPMCIKPYSLHRAHWTWDTYFEKRRRAIDAANHVAMHEFGQIYERRLRRRARNDDAAF